MLLSVPNCSKRFQIFEKSFLFNIRQACPKFVAATTIARVQIASTVRLANVAGLGLI
jgi:hypothetical protein